MAHTSGSGEVTGLPDLTVGVGDVEADLGVWRRGVLIEWKCIKDGCGVLAGWFTSQTRKLPSNWPRLMGAVGVLKL